MKTKPSPTYQKIYSIVKRIPPGKVATYGQIAQLAGLPGHARMVGYALHYLSEESNVPWHRVINAKGEISQLPDPEGRSMQKHMLKLEGVQFDSNGKIPLKWFQWIVSLNNIDSLEI
jgi:methylated-DNA-protein-cysteine methyltransferase-like protein